MNQVVLSPWPPQRNGIADYVFELTRFAEGPTTIVSECLVPRPLAGPVRFLHPVELEPAFMARTPLIYHFGNNPDHVFLIDLFLRYPGVAVVHDATLHYLVELADAAMPGFFDAQLLRECPQSAPALRKLWRHPQMKRGVDFQQVPLLSWLEHAPAIVVHSRFAARIVSGLLPRVKLHVIPHFAYQAPPDLPYRAAQARARLGLGPDDIILAGVGFATRNKQYEAILRALANLPAPLRGRVWLIIGGELRREEIDIPTLAAQMGVGAQVRCLGYLDEPAMLGLLAASDLLLNLRYPSFGESSGVLARALGLGCLVAVTNSGAYAELPDDICIKLAARADPSAELTSLITRLAEDPAGLQEVREGARSFAAGPLHPARIAARYADMLDATYALQ
jgi:glycosyltransferase involved in cell wall biosynthesis